MQNNEIAKTGSQPIPKNSPLAEYFKEVIYGGIDGIVTTFAVVAGFSGAALSTDTTTQLTFMVVLLFGLANLFADAASMGLGNFLSVRSEKDLYQAARAKEVETVRTDTQSEYDATVALMMEKGFAETDARVLADIYKKNESYWVDFMMNHKLEMPDVRGTNPFYTGLATFLSFLVFGAIPLLPFIFEVSADAGTVFYLSVAGTGIALIALGIMKWRVVGAGLKESLFEVLAVGGTAALIAYAVGVYFGG